MSAKGRIPPSIVAAPGQRLPVVQKPLGGKLGYFDPRTGEIALEERQSHASKVQILVHEIMHLCAEKLKQSGICKRQPSELFIQEFSGVVFGVLGASGMLSCVTPREVNAFFRKHLKEKR